MGAIADTLINGEACTECGVHLEPRETVYLPTENGFNFVRDKMPSDGSGYGVPVICKDCYKSL